MQSATTSEPTTKSDPLATLREGEKLAGCYLLQCRVEGAGNRIVWLANDEVLGKDVSLHFVPPAVLDDAEALAVLRHEVKRNRQLIHPSILRVYDFVEEDGWAAVSMDAFTGGTLAARQAATPHGFFEPAEVRTWIENVCQTLDDAHRIKLAHGDVTPENIVIEDSGRVRLANFGSSICIKHALGELEGEHSAHQSAQQLEGTAPTPADDVFGAGVLIHRLLVGAPPFSGPVDRGAAPGIAAHRAKLGKTGGPIPPAWEKVVASCLERSPEARPKSMAEIVQGLALETAQAEGVAEAPPAAKVEEKVTAAPEPFAAKAAEMPAVTMEPVVVKVDEKPVAAPEPEIAKVEEAKPSNIVEAPPVEKKAPAVEKEKESPVEKEASAVEKTGVERKPATEPKPATERTASPPRKAPAKRLIMDDDEDDYVPGGGGGSPWKTIGVGAVVLAAMAGIVIYFSGGDEGTPSAKRETATPVPVADTKKEPAATPVPVKPEVAQVKTPEPVKAPEPVKTPVTEQPKEPVPTASKPDKPEPPVKPAAPEANSKTAEMDAARKALETAEKSVQEAQQRKQNADTALADVKAKSEEKSKSLTPLQRAADEVIAGQKKRETEARTATQAADQAKQTATDKTRLAEESRKAFALADETFKSLQKMATDPATGFAPIKKAADDMAAVRKKRDDDAKVAEAAAQKAQQLADEKAAIAERASKAVTDGEAEGKAKLTAKENAANEFKDLQKELEEKQRAAAEATKALAEAAAKHGQQAALVQNTAKTNTETPAEPKPKDTPGDVKTPADVKTPGTAAIPTVDPDKVKKDGEVMLNSLTEKLKHIGDTPAATTTGEPKPTVAETSSIPAEPTLPANPDAPKAAGPGFVNSLGMKFVPVGDTLFCVWQTRVKDFEAFAKATGLKSTGWRDPGFKQGPEHPVVNVTWQEATLFCKWLTLRERKEGLIGPNQEYRLPTDLEWSAAVGLGDEPGKTPEARDMSVPDVYPWGTQWPPPPGAGNYTGEETGSDVAIHGYSDNFPWTAPVGSFPPNKNGLYDMGGNVWQWMQDNWNGESRAKVLRGASWYNGALKLSLLSSCRVHAAPDSSTDNYGFRVIIVNAAAESGGKPPRK